MPRRDKIGTPSMQYLGQLEELPVYTTQFAQVMRRHRINRRLSQAKLARLLCVDHSYVSRLESGGRHPSLKLVHRLIRAMDLDAQDGDELLRTSIDVHTTPLGVNASRVVAAIYRNAENDMDEAYVDAIIALIEAHANRDCAQDTYTPN